MGQQVITAHGLRRHEHAINMWSVLVVLARQDRDAAWSLGGWVDPPHAITGIRGNGSWISAGTENRARAAQSLHSLWRLGLVDRILGHTIIYRPGTAYSIGVDSTGRHHESSYQAAPGGLWRASDAGLELVKSGWR